MSQARQHGNDRMTGDCETRHCRRCGFIIDFLSTERCPECGAHFDLDDPHTYYTPRGLRRRHLGRVLISLSAVGLLASTVILVVTGAGVLERTDICQLCGCKRECEELLLFDHTFLRYSTDVIETNASRVIAPASACHTHKWKACLERRFDVWGRERFPRTLGRSSLLLIAQDALPEEGLRRVIGIEPKILGVIQDNILKADDDDTAALYVAHIVVMCKDPSKKNIRRQLLALQMIKVRTKGNSADVAPIRDAERYSPGRDKGDP